MHGHPARGRIVRKADLGARNERLERRQDGGPDVAVERVVLVEPRPPRAQRIEERGKIARVLSMRIPSAEVPPEIREPEASSTAQLYQDTWKGWARSSPAGVLSYTRGGDRTDLETAWV